MALPKPLNKFRSQVILLAGLLILSLGMAASWGAVPIGLDDMGEALSHWIRGTERENLAQQVFFSLRLPRILLCAVTGGCLAVSGVVMQAFTRNPIVEPGLTGTSAGAALGASLVFVFAPAFPALLQLISVNILLPLFAFAGAFLATWIVYRFARMSRGYSVTVLLLIGVAVNALAFSGIGFLSYIARDPQARSITFWNLGGFSGASWSQTGIGFCTAVLTLFLLLRLAKPMDLLQLGDQEAGYLGVSVPKVKKQLLWINTLMVATLTAFCGVISFVGLIVPHLMRRVSGARHRELIWLSFFAGAGLLVCADMAARLILSPAELPIGILTALLGAPIFIVLIRKQVYL